MKERFFGDDPHFYGFYAPIARLLPHSELIPAPEKPNNLAQAKTRRLL